MEEIKEIFNKWQRSGLLYGKLRDKKINGNDQPLINGFLKILK